MLRSLRLPNLLALPRPLHSHSQAAAAALSTANPENLLDSSVSNLAAEMHAAGVKRAVVYTDPESQKIIGSHAVLDPIVEFLSQDRIDYNKHEAMFFEANGQAVMGAFLWNTRRGQGCGGIRLREYDSVEGYVRDGMRLAIGMGRKSALAGLWWGGGKGVIAHPNPLALDATERKKLMHEYGTFLTSLRGAYVAAEDAGITVQDMNNVFSKTRFTTCISGELGGSGNPSVPTAHGMVCGMEAAVEFLNPSSTLKGKTIAVQGCGNVGGPMIGMLLEKAVSSIVACDSDPAKVAATAELYKHDARVKIMHSSEINILSQAVDIVSPCAYGGVLNGNTVPHIQAKIVCGAANNQLLDPSTDYGMHEGGRTLYCPDFVVNRMGIVNCANEQYGRVGSESMNDPLVARHLSRDYEHSVFNTLLEVLKESKERDISPAFAADRLADYHASQEHPLFGHRSQQIITALVKDGWAC